MCFLNHDCYGHLKEKTWMKFNGFQFTGSMSTPKEDTLSLIFC